MEASDQFASASTKIETIQKVHDKEKFESPSIKHKHANENLIILPETGVAVTKLPPITADREVRLPCKTPSSPLVQMTPCQQPTYQKNQLHGRNVSTAYISKKLKEPRFVPYEPYKAAINPLITTVKSQARRHFFPQMKIVYLSK